MCRISVIAPVYGVEAYLGRFLESIEEQSFPDFEIILVDDGSRDNCPAMLDAFAEREKRCRVIHQMNQGVSAARNAGLNAARGQYVYMADPDDWLDKDALLRIWEAACRTGADVIYGDFYIEIHGDSRLKKVFSGEFCTDDSEVIHILQASLNSAGCAVRTGSRIGTISDFGGAPWRQAIRREILEKHEIRFDPRLKSLGEDVLFMQEVYEHIKTAAYIQEPIYHYRYTDVSLSHGFKENILSEYRRILKIEEACLKKIGKSGFYWEMYYFRVLNYINLSMEYYFQNDQNGKKEAELYREFRKMVRNHPYDLAIRKAPLHLAAGKKRKLLYLLLHLHLFRVYWLSSRLINKMQG